MKKLFARDQIPDIKLVIALKNKDVNKAELAFKIVYNLYIVFLKDLANKILNDDEEAKDVVHETFLMLFENRRHVIIPDNDLKKFLIQVLRNKCDDILIKRDSEGKYINSTVNFNHNTPPYKLS